MSLLKIEALLRLEELIKRIGLKKPTIYSMMKRGLLPKPIKMGRASLWIESEIDACIAQRIKVRNESNPNGPNNA